MKSSILVILAAVVLGAGLMFCITELMKTSGNSPAGESPGPNQPGGQGDTNAPPTQGVGDGDGKTSSTARSSSQPGISLVKQKRYRIMIVSARLPAKKRNGKEWDINSGLPDCFFVLRTPENRYASATVKNNLVPNWADKSLSVSDLWSGRVRVSNEGAVFLYDPNGESRIYLDFTDTDLAINDTIANVVLAMKDLKAGYTEYKMSYSANSLGLDAKVSREAADMTFTIRIIPDGV